MRSGPLRSSASSPVTWRQPSPSCPISLSAGMTTLSKTHSLKSCLPARLTMGWTRTPSLSRSIRNWLSPPWRSSPAGPVRQSAIMYCERWALLVHTLVPSMRQPSFGPLGTGAHRGEIGAGVGLAHADGEVAFAGGDPGQDRLALRLAAEAQQQRAALPVCDPVGVDGRARRQQLLDHDVALQRRALVPAVAPGPGHPDPAARAQRTAEGGRPVRAEVRIRPPALGLLRFGDEGADLFAQRVRARRHRRRREVEPCHGAP